jgi:hypothetical protein
MSDTTKPALIGIFEVARVLGVPLGFIDETKFKKSRFYDPTFPKVVETIGGVPHYRREEITQYYLFNQDKLPDAIERETLMFDITFRSMKNVIEVRTLVRAALTDDQSSRIVSLLNAYFKADHNPDPKYDQRQSAAGLDTSDAPTIPGAFKRLLGVRWRDAAIRERIDALDAVCALLFLNADYTLIHIKCELDRVRECLKVEPGMRSAIRHWLTRFFNPDHQTSFVETKYANFLKGRFNIRHHA